MGFPDQMFGMDTDEVLSYSTKKVVWIRDRYIGGLYYGLICIVVMWVFFFQILYMNMQFVMKDVKGLPRMWISHPTHNQCQADQPSCKSDYRSLKELDYCHEYSGGLAAKAQAACKYEDKISVMQDGEVDNKYFIPTAVEIVTERRSCTPSPENNFTCDNEYDVLPGSDCLLAGGMCNSRDGADGQFFYVADVKSFVIQFTSSYEQGTVHGSSLDHPASYAICDHLVRKPNVSRQWHERLLASDENRCSKSEIRVVRIPCMEGVACARATKFDILAHTGADKRMEEVRNAGRKVVRGEAFSSLLFPSSSHQNSSAKKSQLTQKSAVLSSKSLRRLEHVQHQYLRDDSSSGALLQHASQEIPGHDTAVAGGGYRPTPDQYTSPWGDVFKVGRLLQLAGADLDNDYNFDGWTSRQSGTVIQVRAIYNNLYPFLSTFGYKQAEYHYEVTELPLPYVSRTMLSDNQPDDYPNTRRYEVRHGVIVWFKVSGTFGVFDSVYFLVMLVTAFALFATATTITDIVSLYLHPRKANFFHMKYEVSPDFSKMWKCQTCNYWNEDAEKKCTGVELWVANCDQHHCGVARPLP